MKPIYINGEWTHYSVYPNGTIFNNKKQSYLKGSIKSDGYNRVGLTINGKTVKYYVHRLVAAAYLENPNSLPVVNHLDNNKLNNHFTNLEWTTQLENLKYKVQQNRQAKGEDCYSAKLTEMEVLEIRYQYSTGLFSHRDLAAKYKVDKKLIWSIINKKIWKHI